MRLELYLTDLFSSTATTIEKCNQMENTLKLSKNIIKKKMHYSVQRKRLLTYQLGTDVNDVVV